MIRGTLLILFLRLFLNRKTKLDFVEWTIKWGECCFLRHFFFQIVGLSDRFLLSPSFLLVMFPWRAHHHFFSPIDMWKEVYTCCKRESRFNSISWCNFLSVSTYLFQDQIIMAFQTSNNLSLNHQIERKCKFHLSFS